MSFITAQSEITFSKATGFLKTQKWEQQNRAQETVWRRKLQIYGQHYFAFSDTFLKKINKILVSIKIGLITNYL